MKTKLLLALLLLAYILFFAAFFIDVAQAQYVLEITSPGTYYLDTSSNTLTRVTATVTTTTVAPQPPTVPVPLLPPSPNREAAVLLSTLFRELAQRITSGEITPPQIVPTAKALAQIAIIRSGGTMEQAIQYATLVEAALINKSPAEIVSLLQQQHSDNRQPQSDNQQQQSDNRQPQSDNQQQQSDNQQQQSDNQQQQSDNRQPHSDNLLSEPGNLLSEPGNLLSEPGNPSPHSSNQLPLELVKLVVTLVVQNQNLDLRTLLSILEAVWPAVKPILTPNRAVYVYEKDQNNIPREVDAALSELLRSGISVSAIDDDVRNVHGDIPAQYAAVLAVAEPPCLVVLDGDQVVRVVKSPTTKQQVLDAIRQEDP